jgi:hypothetical protein
MRDAWKRIPAWAHPIQATWEDFDSKSGLQDDLLTSRVRVPKTIMEGTAGI